MGVIIGYDLAQARLGNVGVDLGGGNVRMTEQFLDQPAIRTAVEKVDGVAVPLNVGSELLLPSHLLPIRGKDTADRRERQLISRC